MFDCEQFLFKLIASTPCQFSVRVHHIPIASASLTVDFNPLKEQGYRLSRHHIADSRSLCKRRTEQSPRLEGSQKDAKYLNKCGI